MNKQSLYLTDLLCLVNEIKSYLPARCHQIYQPEKRVVLLKLTSKTKGKFFILLEASPSRQTIRIIPSNDFKLPKIPYSFCTKMRKHLGNRFLENINIMGVDRIIYLKFSHDHSLILELFDHGNLILVDDNYNIVSLFRSHKYDSDHLLQPNKSYPLDLINLHQFDHSPYSEIMELPFNQLDVVDSKDFIFSDYLDRVEYRGKKVRDVLINVNSPFVWLGKDFIFHVLALLDISPNQKLKSIDQSWLIDFFETFKKEFARIRSSFQPLIYSDDTKPLYFTSFSSQKWINKNFEKKELLSDIINQFWINQNKKQIKKKLPKIKSSQKELIEKSNQKKIKQLNQKIEEINKQIEFLQENQSQFEQLKSTFRSISQDTFVWSSEIGDIVLFKKWNVWKNIEDKYTQIKQINIKIKKVEIGNLKALENIKVKKKPPLKKWEPANFKSYWFEEYHWFFTSEGYLVVGGRNKEQNEAIVKRYMEKGDVYMHSAYGGSPSTLVKKVGKEPPIRTLLQAANFVTSLSGAWKEGSSDKVYWVYPDQVSKTAPTGQFVQSGSFIINGKKNFVSADLSLGVALSFRVKGDAPECFKELPEEECLPVFMVGPVRALEKYPYFAKVKPGNKKRGKMVRKIMDKWKSKIKNTLDKRVFKQINCEKVVPLLPLKINYI